MIGSDAGGLGLLVNFVVAIVSKRMVGMDPREPRHDLQRGWTQRVWATRAATVAAVLLLAPMGSSHAAMAPTPLERAESHLAAGEHNAAGGAFAEYYESLSLRMQTDETGEFVVLQATAAYAKAWETGHDPAYLSASRRLLIAFTRAVEAERGTHSPLLTAARQELARVDKLLAPSATPPSEAEPEPEQEAEPEPELEAVPEPEPTATTEPPDKAPAQPSDTPQRDRLGIGLVAGGCVLIVAGVAVLVQGPIAHAQYERDIDDAGGDTAFTAADLNTARSDVDKLRNGLVAGGAALAAVGVGGVIWGAIRLARTGRTQEGARWEAGPGLAPSMVGLSVRGRF